MKQLLSKWLDRVFVVSTYRRKLIEELQRRGRSPRIAKSAIKRYQQYVLYGHPPEKAMMLVLMDDTLNLL